MLDHAFMEFAATLPVDLKRRGNDGKYLLKQAVAGLLPHEVLTRKKMGFGLPVEHWFRNELRGMTEDLLLSGAGLTRGLFDMKLIRRMRDEHLSGHAAWHDQLWNLLMLELWFQTFTDRRPSTPARSEGSRILVA